MHAKRLKKERNQFIPLPSSFRNFHFRSNRSLHFPFQKHSTVFVI